MSNFVHLIGRVGNIKLPQTDNQPLKMSLATSETYKKDGQKIETTDWHNLVVFNDKMKKVYAKRIANLGLWQAPLQQG